MGGAEPVRRRRSKRVAVDLECQVVDAECVLIGDRIVSLSSDGLLVRTDGGSAKVGDAVIVSFKPPGSGVWIDAEARVTRLLTGSRPGAPGIALELESMSVFERELLAGMIDLRPAPKRRAPKSPAGPSRAPASAVVQRSIIAVAPITPLEG